MRADAFNSISKTTNPPFFEIPTDQSTKNVNYMGEQIIGMMYKASITSVNLVTFTGNAVSVDYTMVIPPIDEFPEDLAYQILTHDMPLIFNLLTGSREQKRFREVLCSFLCHSDNICRLRDEPCKKSTIFEFNRIYPKYNTALNFIVQHLRTDECDTYIASKREIILNMCFYTDKFGFRANKHHTTHKTRVGSTIETVIETRFINYDGERILESQPIRLRIPKSQNISTLEQSGGVAFGCDTKDEFYSMICAAIDHSGIDDLIYSPIQSTGCGGALKTNEGSFTIVLKCRHNMVDALIPSDSTKISRLLINSHLDTKTIRKLLSTPELLNYSPANFYALGLYLKYEELIQHKIKELINASFAKSGFNFIGINCYRPQCQHFSIFRKDTERISSTVSCVECHIAEFCIKCAQTSHVGDCYKPDDEATEEWRRENTRYCPNCNRPVNKDGGCNHITCTCGAHFCWLCNERYVPNDITDHHRRAGMYGPDCEGLHRRRVEEHNQINLGNREEELIEDDHNFHFNLPERQLIQPDLNDLNEPRPHDEIEERPHDEIEERLALNRMLNDAVRNPDNPELQRRFINADRIFHGRAQHEVQLHNRNMIEELLNDNHVPNIGGQAIILDDLMIVRPNNNPPIDDNNEIINRNLNPFFVAFGPHLAELFPHLMNLIPGEIEVGNNDAILDWLLVTSSEDLQLLENEHQELINILLQQ
jgi:hypothetical protein